MIDIVLARSLILIGVFLLLLGFVVRYVINRRKFYRRGPSGLARFRSFEKAFLVTLIEKFFWILSTVFFFTGVFLILFALLIKEI